ncbi:MAG: hypothetical protein AB7I13_13515 [Vicinamibacterales bacterium]
MGLQDVIVTLVALGAVAIVVRRVAGLAWRDTSPACAKCTPAQPSPSASAFAPDDPTAPSASRGVATYPLTFVRPQRT